MRIYRAKFDDKRSKHAQANAYEIKRTKTAREKIINKAHIKGRENGKKGKNTKNAKNTRKNAAKKLSICPLMK